MRDRLISIAAPREPEPPAFKVIPSTGIELPAPSEDGFDLTAVKGIGPVYAERLREAGIAGIAELAGAEASAVALAADVPENRAEEWIRQAATQTAQA